MPLLMERFEYDKNTANSWKLSTFFSRMSTTPTNKSFKCQRHILAQAIIYWNMMRGFSEFNGRQMDVIKKIRKQEIYKRYFKLKIMKSENNILKQILEIIV